MIFKQHSHYPSNYQLITTFQSVNIAIISACFSSFFDDFMLFFAIFSLFFAGFSSFFLQNRVGNGKIFIIFCGFSSIFCCFSGIFHDLFQIGTPLFHPPHEAEFTEVGTGKGKITASFAT